MLRSLVGSEMCIRDRYWNDRRNRPADADRAFKNLTTLVQAYLG